MAVDLFRISLIELMVFGAIFLGVIWIKRVISSAHLFAEASASRHRGEAEYVTCR